MYLPQCCRYSWPVVHRVLLLNLGSRCSRSWFFTYHMTSSVVLTLRPAVEHGTIQCAVSLLQASTEDELGTPPAQWGGHIDLNT